MRYGAGPTLCYSPAMHRQSTIPLLAASALTLGACANDIAEYPALARRPMERVTGEIAPVVPKNEPGPAPSAEAVGQIDSLVAAARAANARFRAHEGQASHLVRAATGAPMGSESWAVASVAVAQLESARSDGMVALAQLDAIYAAARVDAGDARTVANARETVMALVAEQDELISALKDRMGS